MKPKLFATAAIAALATVSIADAADWSGVYFGINLGGAWVTDDETTTPNPVGWTVPGAANIAGLTAGSVTPNGFSGGAQLGVNWQAPGSSFVWGIEGDIAFAGGDDDRSVTGFGAGVNPADVFQTQTENKFIATLRPRAGFTSGDVLFYATGGLAIGSFDLHDYFGSFGNTAIATVDDTPTLTGWTLGGGIEWQISSDVSLKAEYLYSDFGSTDTLIPSCGPCAVGSDIGVHHDLTANVARIGLNFKL